MKLFDNLIKKYSETAGKGITSGVKTEIRNGLSDSMPIIIGVGLLVIGFAASGGKSIRPSASAATKEVIRSISVTTNNYFLDSAMKEEVVSKIIGR